MIYMICIERGKERLCVCVYIYIYIEREREREREAVLYFSHFLNYMDLL